MLEKDTLSQVLCATVASLAYFGVGFARSWASTGLPSLNDPGVNGTNVDVLPQAPLDPAITSWIVSLPPLGAMVGSASSSVTLNFLGRKWSLIVCGLIFFLGFLLIGLAQIQSTVALILLGRALSGIGVGLAVPSASIYIAECSTPELRGKLGTMPPLLLAAAVFLIYIVGIYLPWHHLAYMCCGPTLLLAVAMFFLPESPPHLVRKGKYDEATKSMAWLRGSTPELMRGEVDKMGNSGNEGGKQEDVSIWSEIFSRKTLHPLSLTMALHFIQTWCGINVIIFNTVNVFNVVGSSVDSSLSAVIVGGVQFFATGLSIVVVDKAGRRILLIVSGLVMAVSMAAVAIYLQLANAGHSTDGWGWLPLAAFIVAFIGYSVGFATIPFALMGELLPAKTRSLTGSFSSTFNLATLFLILKFYTSIATAIGYHGLFWLFTGISIVGVAFVALLLPETKGKSMQEIEMLFNKK